MLGCHTGHDVVPYAYDKAVIAAPPRSSLRLLHHDRLFCSRRFENGHKTVAQAECTFPDCSTAPHRRYLVGPELRIFAPMCAVAAESTSRPARRPGGDAAVVP